MNGGRLLFNMGLVFYLSRNAKNTCWANFSTGITSVKYAQLALDAVIVAVNTCQYFNAFDTVKVVYFIAL